MPDPAASSLSDGVFNDTLNADIQVLLETQRFIDIQWSQPLATTLVQGTVMFLCIRQIPGMRVWEIVFGTFVIFVQYLFVKNFASLATQLRDVLCYVAARGQDPMGQAMVMNPSTLVTMGFDTTSSLIENKTLNALEIFGTMFAAGFTGVTELAFMAMTCGAIIAVEQWYYVLAICTSLMPFIVAPPLRAIADRGAQFFIGSTVWLSACAMAIATVGPSMDRVKTGTDSMAHDLAVMTCMVILKAFTVAMLPAVLGFLAAYGAGGQVLSATIGKIGMMLAKGAAAAAAAGIGGSAGAATTQVINAVVLQQSLGAGSSSPQQLPGGPTRSLPSAVNPPPPPGPSGGGPVIPPAPPGAVGPGPRYGIGRRD